MSVPNLFILSGVGEVLIEKQWAGRLKRNVCEIFWDETAKISSRVEVPPIVSTPRFFFLSSYRFGLTFLTVVTEDVPPVFIMEFHALIADVIQEYFGADAVNEQSIRENFTILLQLLDEMVDGGFPLTTELNQLKDMILPPSLARRLFANVSSDSSGFSAAVSQDLPTHAVSKIPWRKADVKYVTNEIYFDVIESIDAILGPNQNILHANIFGEIACNCRLSGMPDLTLSFTRPSLLDDVSLHRCVRINRYTRERVISFVPPDGKFKLLSYRTAGNIQMPIYVKPMVTYSAGSGRIHIMVGSKLTPMGGSSSSNEKPITNVVIHLPLPAVTRATSLNVNVGTIRIDSRTQQVRWEIGRLPKDKTATMEGSITLPSDYVPDEMPSVRAEFVVKMLASSGLKVDGLSIRGVSYKPFKGVRSSTQAGKFVVRCIDT